VSVEWIVVDCPYCGESFETSVDVSAGGQTYTEDCAVCCRPIVVTVAVDDAGALDGVTTRREAD
jgi:hypothetical protein